MLAGAEFISTLVSESISAPVAFLTDRADMESAPTVIPMIKKTLFEAGIIITVAVILSVCINFLRPDGINFFQAYDNESEILTKGIKKISIKDAGEKFFKGEALFIDARNSIEFSEGHIKGALNLCVDGFEEWIKEFLPATDPETFIITYCDGIECDLAQNLAEELYFAGFNNACYMSNGWSLWNENSLPVYMADTKQDSSE